MSKSLSVSPEINLLGKTVDEAVSELDKYLDDALLSHLSTVRVVHGKGTGALRKGIHEFLRRQKHVKVLPSRGIRRRRRRRHDRGVKINGVIMRGVFMIAKQKILIVDDDENIAELISLYLMKECFDTKIVSRRGGCAVCL